MGWSNFLDFKLGKLLLLLLLGALLLGLAKSVLLLYPLSIDL